nr:unnamed protein product [Callosobruchus analis]
MLECGIVEKAKTDFISPLVVVKKKDGTARICLHKRTKKDFVNPPVPNDTLYSFKKGQVFSTIDLTANYWQIKINPLHSKFIGFIYEGESYIFKKLPLGLSASMASLIRCLKGILAPCEKYVDVYIDDIRVHSDSVELHFYHLKMIFEIFLQRGDNGKTPEVPVFM